MVVVKRESVGILRFAQNDNTEAQSGNTETGEALCLTRFFVVGVVACCVVCYSWALALGSGAGVGMRGSMSGRVAAL
jgi:hypothetical protein